MTFEKRINVVERFYGQDTVLVTISDVKELLAYVDENHKFWAAVGWFKPLDEFSETVNRKIREQQVFLESFKKSTEGVLVKLTSNPGDTEAVERLRDQFGSSVWTKWIPCDSILAKHVRLTNQRDKKTAACLFFHYLDLGSDPDPAKVFVEPSERKWLEHHIDALAERKFFQLIPSEERFEIYKNKLDSLYSNANETLNQISRDSEFVSSKRSEIERHFRDYESEAVSGVMAQIESGHQRFKALDERYEEVRAAFRNKFSMAVSASHWSAKCSHNRTAAIVSFLVFVVLCIAIIGYFYKAGLVPSIIEAPFAPVAISQAVDSINGSVDSAGSKHSSVFIPQTIYAIFLLLIIGWVLRSVYRIFLTNFAAYNDAKERVVMFHTYLNLLEDDKAIEDADRILILQALFRPTAAMGGSDDGVPPNWFDILLQRVGRS